MFRTLMFIACVFALMGVMRLFNEGCTVDIDGKHHVFHIGEIRQHDGDGGSH